MVWTQRVDRQQSTNDSEVSDDEIFNPTTPISHAIRLGSHNWQVTAAGRHTHNERLALQAAPNGDLYLLRGGYAWIDDLENDYPHAETLYVDRYRVGEGWRAWPNLVNAYPTLDSAALAPYSVLDGDLAVDAAGNAVVAWIDNYDVREGGTGGFHLYTAVISATTQPRVTKHYYANGQRIATRIDDGVDDELYYILSDHLGSTSLVVDESGAEVGHVIYDAYGQVVENTLPEGLTDRLYTGQVLDASTGLFYYNARYYDPVVGQFTQPDSIVPDPLDPAAWNRFSYVYGNPNNLTDPSGHCPWCLPLLATAAIAGTLNVGINAGAAYLSGEQYTWSDAGWDFGIGAFFGGAAFLVGGASVPAALAGSRLGTAAFITSRTVALGGLSILEAGTTALVKGDPFTTNDALWAFGTGLLAVGVGKYLGNTFKQRATRMMNDFDDYFSRSVRNVGNGVRSANMRHAARVGKHLADFPESKLIQELANYHMLQYVRWEMEAALPLYEALLRRREVMFHTVAAVRTVGFVGAATLGDNEYIGLLRGNLPGFGNPHVIIPGR